MNEEMITKQSEIEQEINILVSKLTAPTSPIGDWKVNKTYEYRMLGKPDPYDFEELCRQREEVREQINKLQQEFTESEE